MIDYNLFLINILSVLHISCTGNVEDVTNVLFLLCSFLYNVNNILLN